jgi:chaperonin cofactor prefoldin
MKKKKTTWQRIVKAIPSIEKKSEEAEKALKNLKKLKEDAPINNAGGGAIAGLGTVHSLSPVSRRASSLEIPHSCLGVRSTLSSRPEARKITSGGKTTLVRTITS